MRVGSCDRCANNRNWNAEKSALMNSFPSPGTRYFPTYLGRPCNGGSVPRDTSYHGPGEPPPRITAVLSDEFLSGIDESGISASTCAA